MKKYTFSIILLLCLVAVGCSPNKDDHSNSNQQNSTSQSSNQNANTSKASSGAGGFDFDGLVSSLTSAGFISDNGTTIDLSDLGAIKAVCYDNLLIVQFNLDNNSSYFTIYNEGKALINGNQLQVGGIVGPYMLFFFDNQIDQDAVRVFQAVGGL